ncbi:MAG TPA: hypothetical protein VNL71_13735 [Chloroflexota bacterium]|nr:hypothetical protein [Chloroflexota bacterium]
MHVEDDVRFLSAIPYFHGLSPDELSHIRAWCHERELAAGEVLFVIVKRKPAHGHSR